jgi:hypothetical protein
MRTAPHSDNLYLGKGALYCDVLDANGARTGEFHLGNVTSGVITQSDEEKELYSSMSATSPLLKKTLNRRTVELTLTGNEFSPENMKLIFMGTEISVTQAAGTVTDEEFATNVVPGRWYEVGKRQISNVSLKDQANAALTVTTDYLVDAERGRIYVVPGGGIANGDDLKWSGSHNALANATALPAIAGGTVTVHTCFLRFVGDPAAGPAMEVEVWKASVSRDGGINLIGDDWGTFSLKAKVEDDAANHPTAPYYRVIRPIAADAA